MTIPLEFSDVLVVVAAACEWNYSVECTFWLQKFNDWWYARKPHWLTAFLFAFHFDERPFGFSHWWLFSFRFVECRKTQCSELGIVGVAPLPSNWFLCWSNQYLSFLFFSIIWSLIRIPDIIFVCSVLLIIHTHTDHKNRPLKQNKK